MVPTFDTSPWGAVDGAVSLELPQTLHAQLFLLAYDRFRGRLDGNDRWRFGLALRTAMLTDLYLTGHLIDEDNRPRSVDGTRKVIDAVHSAIQANDTGPYST
jgi:hypothetical protein